MKTEEGYEIPSMSKQEAKASVDEMGKMMEYFNGICECCGKQRRDCKGDCPRINRGKE